ncbi:efflux RND transporter periplasmic adaptor subunit [Couchioplanes caeruleus]|uniref:efflux RND transporter periplasmic adaptor subunit n=1 Tax=Couchioplanes caeruleus TaxID=56438 RepID=UPI0020BF5794|nr:efflux RND transporter periplasmic adaptor subunit [Couchioplanes caeruleus]UQU61333.1 efflux RND transporter periplasmic adaptor subunit [Couchioplanes caeruleus]
MGIGGTAWRGGRRRWAWLAAGAVVAVLPAAGVARALTAGADTEPAVVATVAADRGAVTTEVATTGTVRPAQTRSLSFAVAGTVEAVTVRPGTVVTAGQELARIDDSDATEAVHSAREALADAEDALQEARDQAATTGSECGLVPAAYASAPAPTSAGATPAPTRTSAPAATARPTRTPAPTRTGAPARTSAPARGGAPTTTAACGGADQQGGRQGGGADAVLSAEQRVNQAAVAVAKAEDDLEGTTITAPIAGRVLSVSGKVGSRVGAGSAFLNLAGVSGMQISAAFPEADADRLAVRQQAVVTLADRAGETFTATVVQVDPVGTSDGTLVRYGVVLSFDDAPGNLLVGQSAAVRVTTGAKRDVLRVPSTAVHDVAGPAGTVLRAGARVRVGVGLRGDAYTEITSGLAQGDVVARSW